MIIDLKQLYGETAKLEKLPEYVEKAILFFPCNRVNTSF